MRKWIRAISFLLVGWLLFILFSNILLEKWGTGYAAIQRTFAGYRNEKEDSLDFVFFGNSRMLVSVNPSVLWEQYGITSYNYSALAQTIPLTYYYIEEALKTQHPKAIILNVTSDGNKIEATDDVLHFNLDYLPWSMTKVKAIINCVPKDHWLEYFFPILYSHDNWKELDEEFFEYMHISGEDNYKGYGFLSPYREEVVYPQYNYPYDMQDNIEQYCDDDMVEEDVLIWYQKIIELTKQEEIELILIGVPNGSPPEEQGRWNPIFKYALEQNITCINYNLQMTGVPHNGADNAEKFTKVLGKDLIGMYEIDKRDIFSPEYEAWNKTVGVYRQEYRAEDLKNTLVQENWFELANDENYTIFFAVNTEVLGGQQILEKIFDLGGEKSLQCQGKIVGIVSQNYINYDFDVGELTTYFDWGDKVARISIDALSVIEIEFGSNLLRGTDCSIMIYDNVLNRVVDGVSINGANMVLTRESIEL